MGQIPASVTVRRMDDGLEIPKEPLLLDIARSYPQVNDRVLKVLLKHGANVNIRNENGDTFLHLVAQKQFQNF